MKVNLPNTLSILLAVLLMLPLFASCGGGDAAGNEAENYTETAGETSAAGTETEALKPDLPDRDFNGRDFTILTQSWGTYKPLDFTDIAPEELDGEVLNDAAFNRNVKMSTAYNCSILQANETSASAAMSKITATVSAGEDAYDIAFVRGTNFSVGITSGFYTELNDIPFVDYDMPWWDSDSLESLAICGKSYVVCGDISTNDMMAVWNVCFNKKLIDDYSLDSPYELVTSGKWTFDKSIEMSKSVAHDVDGDGKMGKADMWGINHTNDTVIGILNACGVRIAESDKNGIPQVTINSEKSVTRTVDIFTKLFNEEYAVDTLSRPHMQLTDSDGELFRQDLVLFLYTATHMVGALRQMDVEFGLLPYPKYAESENYAPCTAGIFLPMIVVPVTNTELEDTGFFMEAYAYEGWANLVPAYYDVILQGKFASDNESGEILDYVYGNITYDIGNIYNFDSFTSAIGGLSKSMDTDFASFIAGRLSPLQAAIDALVEKVS